MMRGMAPGLVHALLIVCAAAAVMGSDAFSCMYRGSATTGCNCPFVRSSFGNFGCLQEKEPRLPGLLKLLLWAQNQLDEKVHYPRMNDLVSGNLSSAADMSL